MAKDKESKLPDLIEKSIAADQESTAKANEASRVLSQQMKVFASSNQAFTKATLSLNNFAKTQIDKINPFKKMKEGLDKTFAGRKLVQRKEENRLAQAAGISREQLLNSKANKDLVEAQAEQARALSSSLSEYGVSLEKVMGKEEKKEDVKEEKDDCLCADRIIEGIRKSFGVATEAEDKRDADSSNQQLTAFKALGSSITDMRSGLISQSDSLSKEISSAVLVTGADADRSRAAQMAANDLATAQAKTDLMNSLDGMGSAMSMQGETIGKVVSSGIGSAFKKSDTAKIEGEREGARRAAEQTTLLERIGSGINELGKGLLAGLKGLGEKGGLGVGMLFGIIAAPVIALVSFFKSLKAEFAFLNKVFKGNLTKPFIKAIDFIKDIGSKFSKTFSPKNVPVDEILKPFKAMGVFFKDIGTKLGALFGKSGTFGKVFGVISKGFAPIAKFAASFGSVLGKLVLPITIIMGIVDTVTGFMEGYDSGGILGGVMGAIKGLFNGLIMKPLDLLKDAVSWIAGKLGFENFSEMLDSFSFEDIFSGLVDGVQNILESVGEWFNDKIDWVKGLLGFETSREEAERLKEEDEAKKDEPKKTNVLTKSGVKSLTKEEIQQGKKEGTIKRSLANDALARLKREEAKAKKDERKFRGGGGADKKEDPLRDRAKGKGTPAGLGTGEAVNAKSAKQAGGGSVNIVNTSAPTVVNAPNSTSMNSQTTVSSSPRRERGLANRARQVRERAGR